jgi:hypothetical protein
MLDALLFPAEKLPASVKDDTGRRDRPREDSAKRRGPENRHRDARRRQLPELRPSPSPIPRFSFARDVTWRWAKSRRSMKRSTGDGPDHRVGDARFTPAHMYVCVCVCARAYTHTCATYASGGNLDGRCRPRFFFERCHRCDLMLEIEERSPP